MARKAFEENRFEDLLAAPCRLYNTPVLENTARRETDPVPEKRLPSHHINQRTQSTLPMHAQTTSLFAGVADLLIVHVQSV